MNKVMILGVYKHEIICKKRTRKTRKNYLIYLSSIVIFLILSLSFGGSELKQVVNSMAYIYNPVNSLYNDNSDIVFTNGSVLNVESLNFVVPIKSAEFDVLQNGTIIFKPVKSIMVTACESGVVDGVGVTNDGVKYIKIKHTADIYSLIENVDIVGVQENEIVKKGQDIATCKLGEKLTFQLFNGDIKLMNLQVDKSKIIWQN